MDGDCPALRAIARLGRHGLMLVPILFLLVFFLYPLASILEVSFRLPDGRFHWQSIFTVLRSPYYRSIIGFTVFQATLSTVITLLLAIPGAHVLVRYRFRGKTLLRSLSMLPFVLPTVVVAASFSALIGKSGIVNEFLMRITGTSTAPIQLEQTLAIIILAHVFYNYPLALRMISGYWTNQSPLIEETARVLGAHGWRLWLYIRIPLLRPILLATAALVFLFTFTSFGVIIILGGARFATLEVEIYRQAVNMFNLPVAGALSVIQMAGMFLLMAFYAQRQTDIAGTHADSTQVAIWPRRLHQRFWIGINVAFIGILLFAPLLALTARSLGLPQNAPTLRYFAMLPYNPRASVLFVPPVTAIWNSLQLALATTVVAVALGLLVSNMLSKRHQLARWLDPLFMLPLATSPVTLGFGYIIALDEPPLNLRTSPILILFAHVLVALPFVIRNILPATRAIPADIREAARVLGASPWHVWRRIELPLISRSIVVGAVFAFTVSMGEFGASLFIARPEFTTLPVAIYRLLGQPGASNYGQGLALSVVLLMVCASGFLLLDRLGATNDGEF